MQPGCTWHLIMLSVSCPKSIQHCLDTFQFMQVNLIKMLNRILTSILNSTESGPKIDRYMAHNLIFIHSELYN